MLSQVLKLVKLEIIKLLKKNIYKTNNIQKELMPLMAKYIEILIRVFGISDSKIFLLVNYTLT